MSKPTARFNVTAARPYTDRDGNEKKMWLTCGRATQWDDGNISIEVNTMPTGNWWDGKLMLFPQDENRQQGQRQERPARQREETPRSSPPVNEGFDDDDIPF